MRTQLVRLTTVAALCVPLIAVGVVAAGPAAAQPVESGSLTMTSEPGDPIGNGQDYDYSTPAGDQFTTFSGQGGGHVFTTLFAANGDTWSVDIAAPEGQALTARTYTDAARVSFRPVGAPGLEVSGNGQFCGSITGSFTVAEVTIIDSYVQSVDATFEQRCDFSEAALHGRIRIQNPPPPPPLQLDPTVSAEGTASSLNGRATIGGSITCTQDVDVQLSGALTQVKHRRIIRGAFSIGVPCTAGSPAAWEVTIDPFGDVPYQRGDAGLEVSAQATDPAFQREVTVNRSGVVRLRVVRSLSTSTAL